MTNRLDPTSLPIFGTPTPVHGEVLQPFQHGHHQLFHGFDF